jgi:hypothetical protein
MVEFKFVAVPVIAKCQGQNLSLSYIFGYVNSFALICSLLRSSPPRFNAASPTPVAGVRPRTGDPRIKMDEAIVSQ